MVLPVKLLDLSSSTTIRLPKRQAPLLLFRTLAPFHAERLTVEAVLLLRKKHILLLYLLGDERALQNKLQEPAGGGSAVVT